MTGLKLLNNAIPMTAASIRIDLNCFGSKVKQLPKASNRINQSRTEALLSLMSESAYK